MHRSRFDDFMGALRRFTATPSETARSCAVL